MLCGFIFNICSVINEKTITNGRILIWYVFLASWGTDIFAYLIGRHFGKHKFTDISPNKSIEGCIGGLLGAFVMVLVYTFVCNKVWNMDFSYVYSGFIAILLSVLSQIGDLAGIKC